MKKRLAAVLAAGLLLLLLLQGCASGQPSESNMLVPVLSAGEKPATGAEIALIVTESQRGKVFGLAVWHEINRFAGEQGLTCGSYLTEENDLGSALATLELAVTGGAQLVVALGDMQAGMVQQGQVLYPELDFVLMDSEEPFVLQKNTVRMVYPPEQAGWLAGYAAVWDDAQKLAYQEALSKTAQLYALGFLLGAEQAAEDRHLQAGSITVLPVEVVPENSEESAVSDGDSDSQDSILSDIAGQSLASSSGSEDVSAPQNSAQSASFPAQIMPAEPLVSLGKFAEEDYTIVFANDPENQRDIFTKVRTADSKMIGVGDELSQAFGTVLSVTQKSPGEMLYTVMTRWKEDDFPKGEQLLCGIAEYCVTLSLDLPGFERFNQKRYEMTLEKFSQGDILQTLQRAAEGLEEDRPLNQQLQLVRLAFYAPPVPESSSSASVSASDDVPQEQGATSVYSEIE